MSDEKLIPELEQVKMKQTSPIRFRDETINKIRKEQFKFGKKRDLFIPFIVSKDSHQKGLKLRIYKGTEVSGNLMKLLSGKTDMILGN